MSAFVLIEAVEVKGLGGGGVVAPAFGDVQVAGVFDGCDDGSPDSGQVNRSAAGTAGRGIFAEASMDQCSRVRRARSCGVASALVRLVMA